MLPTTVRPQEHRQQSAFGGTCMKSSRHLAVPTTIGLGDSQFDKATIWLARPPDHPRSGTAGGATAGPRGGGRRARRQRATPISFFLKRDA